MTDVYGHLERRVLYAVENKSEMLLVDAFGKMKMALYEGCITSEQFDELHAIILKSNLTQT